MGSRATLYEMLGVRQEASLPELQSAYRHQVSLLEAARAGMSLDDFNDKAQLLRVAMSTLGDPVSRLSYDTKLAGACRAVGTALATRDPAVRGIDAASTLVRADALALRADALSLRADAMLVRAAAGGDATLPGRDAAHVIGSVAVTALKRISRAIGLLVLVGIAAFWVARFAVGDSSARRAAMEAKAAEKTALQEYFQTYGVRPANMAELESLETERRRRENQGRQAERDREKQEKDARRFDEESRQRAREVSEQLQATEERARRFAEREEQMKHQERMMREQAEQRRIEMEKQQWRATLRQ